MSIPSTRRRKMRPVHPGELLREEFMPDYGLTVASLAKALGVTRQSVNELVREKKSVSPEMAIRLGALFGNSAQIWLNIQRELDLWLAEEHLGARVKDIKPISAA